MPEARKTVQGFLLQAGKAGSEEGIARTGAPAAEFRKRQFCKFRGFGQVFGVTFEIAGQLFAGVNAVGRIGHNFLPAFRGAGMKLWPIRPTAFTPANNWPSISNVTPKTWPKPRNLQNWRFRNSAAGAPVRAIPSSLPALPAWSKKPCTVLRASGIELGSAAIWQNHSFHDLPE